MTKTFEKKATHGLQHGSGRAFAATDQHVNPARWNAGAHIGQAPLEIDHTDVGPFV